MENSNSILFIYFGHTTWHAGLSSPDQGLNLCLLQWQCGFLITGPPGKSLTFILDLSGIKLSILGWQMSPNQFHFS